MILLHVSRTLAEHLALACKRHLEIATKFDRPVPDGFEDVMWLLVEVAHDGQEQSAGDDVPMREWVTTAEAAEITGLSQSTLRRRLLDGSLASSKVNRCRRIRRTDLAQFMGEAA